MEPLRTTGMAVIDLMSPAKVVQRDMQLGKALDVLKAGKADILSVVDERQVLIGAVSETSFVRLIKHTPSSPLGDPVWYDSLEPGTSLKPVESIMTTNITTVRPNDSIDTALKVMNSAGYYLVHVVDSEGRLLGVLGIKDIFEKLLGAPDEPSS